MSTVKGGNTTGPSDVAIDEVGGEDFQLVKLAFGDASNATRVSENDPLPVTLFAQDGDPMPSDGINGMYVQVQGTVTVQGAGDSLTVDAPVGTPVFVRLSDGSSPIATLPVSAASLPLPSGAATSAKQPALGTAGSSSADVLSVQGIASGTSLPISAASLPLPSGAATSAKQDSAATLTGAVNETAPGTDTADSGLNGRLQRIAQRLTSLITLLPTSLGQKTKANSLAVTLASDQDALPASQSGTWNVNNVSGTVSLPTGASTAAKQPALGTAGTASSDVITVQGVASMTPVAVVGKGTRISQTPTISASSIYASGDAVGGLLTFANAARVSGGTITITAVLIVDNDQELAPMELVLFDRTFSNVSDNAAFDVTDAELATCIGVIKVSDYASFLDNSIATRQCALTAKLNGTDLFGQLVVRSTPTYTATTDITVIVEVVQD